MHRYERSVVIAAPIDEVFGFHEDPENLLRITPPSVKLRIVEVRGERQLGRRIRLRMTQFGLLRQDLLIEFVEYDPPRRLVDQQKEGPFTFWRQTRTFTALQEGTRLTDLVEYKAPFGLLGRIAVALVIAPRVKGMFEYRQRRMKEILEGSPTA